MQKIVWRPTKDQIKSSRIHEFINFLNTKKNTTLSNSDELYQWSINNTTDFWSSFWQFSEIISSKTWNSVLDNGNDMLNATWFNGAQLNYAENLLRRHDSEIAIIFRGEDKVEWKFTHKELHTTVAKLAQSLRNLGVKSGDRVAAFMPNLPHTIMAMLATQVLGQYGLHAPQILE